MSKAVIILVIIWCFLSLRGYSQRKADSIPEGHKNTINLSIAGKTRGFDIEYARRLGRFGDVQFTLGAGVSIAAIIHDILFPTTFYMSYGNRWKLEWGVGATLLLALNPNPMSRDEFFEELPDGAAPYKSSLGFNYHIQLGVKYELDRWHIGGYGLLLNPHPIYTKERVSTWFPRIGVLVGYKF